MVLVLERQSLDQLMPLFRGDSNVHEWIISEIRQGLGDAHARLFARPDYSGQYVRWIVEGKESLNWKDLSQAQQEQLLNVMRSIVSDIRHYVADYPYSFISRYFPACCQFPSLENLYAVDGYPVITGWGYREKQSVFNPLEGMRDKKRIFIIPAGRIPWGTAIAFLSLGILAAILWHGWKYPVKMCRMTYPSLMAVEDAQSKEKLHQELLAQKKALLLQLPSPKLCRVTSTKPNELPEDTPLEPMEPLPDLPPVKEADSLPDAQIPPIKEDLPKSAWKKQDTSFLSGCWKLTTHLEIFSEGDVSTSRPVRDWSLCFDSRGQGQQKLVDQNGHQCKGPIQARFHGNQLVINELQDCTGDFHLMSGRNECVRLNEHQARCTNIMQDGTQTTGIFKR